MSSARTPELPVHWEKKTLGQCARFINGRAYSQEELLDQGTPVIRIQNLNGGDRWYYSNLQLPDDKYCVAGDLLFAWSASFGPYLWYGDRAIFHYHIWRILPSPGVEKAFLYRLLEWITARVKAASRGVAMLHMTKAGIEAWEVSIPPLPEQRRIAAILDQADALRAKRREALAELDSLTQSIFIEMFGDPASNPKSWPELQLGELIQGAPNNGIFKKNEEYGAGMPVVWVEELFKGNEIDCSASRALQASPKDVARYGLRNGDLLFCRSSLKLAGIGYNNVYLGEDGKALFECHLIRISPDKDRVEPRFLNFALRMPSQRQKLFRFAKTVTMTTIDQDGLLKISVPVPPLERQRKFCERLTAVDLVRRRQAATLEELDDLFASLQYRAFAGQLS